MDDDANSFDYDEYAECIRRMLEKDQRKVFDYYFRCHQRKRREMLDKAFELLWEGDVEDILDIIVDKYNELIATDENKIDFKIRFNIPYWEGSSIRMNTGNLKQLFNMMNAVVPDARGVLLKEVVFDWIEDSMCNIENLSKKYIFNDKFNKFKAAYMILEVEQFMSGQTISSMDTCFANDIASVWGDAVASLDCFLSFNLEKNINDYYRIGQGVIQRERAHDYKFYLDYREALRMALRKWKDGDPSDHQEMATYLIKRPEFDHLELRLVLKWLKPYARRRNRLRGVKNYRKIKDE